MAPTRRHGRGCRRLCRQNFADGNDRDGHRRKADYCGDQRSAQSRMTGGFGPQTLELGRQPVTNLGDSRPRCGPQMSDKVVDVARPKHDRCHGQQPSDRQFVGDDMPPAKGHGLPLEPGIEGQSVGDVMLAEEVILSRRRQGARVLVADWPCDRVGPGVAVMLAARGHTVQLAVEGIGAGPNLPQYVRDTWAGRLHDAGVPVISFATIFGVDADTVWLTHVASDRPITCEGVDSVVLSTGRRPADGLAADLSLLGISHVLVGDCVTRRTGEEAIFEGMVVTLEALDRLSVHAG